MVLVHPAHTGLMPKTCAVICRCTPEHDCYRRLDIWLDWRDFLYWLMTDGPGRVAQRDHQAVRRTHINNHEQNGIIPL